MKSEYQSDFKPKYDLLKSFTLFLLVLIVPILTATIFQFILILAQINIAEAMEKPVFVILQIIIVTASYYVLFFTFAKTKKMEIKKNTPFSFKIKPLNLILCLLISLVCVFGLQYFISLVDFVLAKIGYNNPGKLPFAIDNFGMYFLAVVLFAVSPAFIEEMFFRNALMGGLRTRQNEKAAIFTSAALFSLFHGSALQTIYPFILGVVFAYILFKTGNIFYSMITHFANNFIVITIEYIYTKSGNENTLPALTTTRALLYILLALVSGVVIYFLVKLLKKDSQPSQSEIDDVHSDNVECVSAPTKKRLRTQDKVIIIGAVVIGVMMWVIDFLTYTGVIKT